MGRSHGIGLVGLGRVRFVRVGETRLRSVGRGCGVYGTGGTTAPASTQPAHQGEATHQQQQEEEEHAAVGTVEEEQVFGFHGKRKDMGAG